MICRIYTSKGLVKRIRAVVVYNKCIVLDLFYILSVKYVLIVAKRQDMKNANNYNSKNHDRIN